MARMTGGEAIVAQLRRQGVDTVFGLPGAQLYGLFDAMQRDAGLRVVSARHEQACGYMAFGAARSTGRPAAYSVVPGPGVMNTAAALVTALGANSPVLCLTGQVPSAFLGRGRGHLHEMPDQLATLRGVVKWAARIEHPAEAPRAVAQAFQEMLSGRPGPAALEMPWDRFTQTAEVAPAEPLGPLPPPAVDEDALERAARLVRAARAPMIFVGGGALDAGAEILELAELMGAPVVAFRSGRGVVDDDHPLGLTIAAAHRLWPQTDLVLGIGTRLEVPGWRWGWNPETWAAWSPPGLKTVRIDIDPVEFRRVPADVAVLADAAAGARGLSAALRRLGLEASRGRGEAIASAKRWAAREIESVQPQLAYLRAIREVLPRDGFFCDELSQVGFASWYGLPIHLPRTFVSSGYQGTLGSGFLTALGVKVANPDRAVVSVCGDGGFLFGVQDLATAAQERIGVVTLVFNNSGYGNVRRDQVRGFGGRVVAADLENPDFVRLAEAFGVSGARVSSPEALRPVLERALANDVPALIEVQVPRDSESDPWRFIHPPSPAAG
jgi:acetolactate synthase-1/2/3 large subunit